MADPPASYRSIARRNTRSVPPPPSIRPVTLGSPAPPMAKLPENRAGPAPVRLASSREKEANRRPLPPRNWAWATKSETRSPRLRAMRSAVKALPRASLRKAAAIRRAIGSTNVPAPVAASPASAASVCRPGRKPFASTSPCQVTFPKPDSVRAAPSSVSKAPVNCGVLIPRNARL